MGQVRHGGAGEELRDQRPARQEAAASIVRARARRADGGSVRSLRFSWNPPRSDVRRRPTAVEPGSGGHDTRDATSPTSTWRGERARLLLLGPSGCGKDDGPAMHRRVRRVATAASDRRRGREKAVAARAPKGRIGMVFQDCAVPHHRRRKVPSASPTAAVPARGRESSPRRLEWGATAAHELRAASSSASRWRALERHRAVLPKSRSSLDGRQREVIAPTCARS